MATPMKCPNPACTFLFDPSQVPPGAMIACPLCTFRFTLANTPAAPVAPSMAPSFPPSEELEIFDQEPDKPGQQPKSAPQAPGSKGGTGAGMLVVYAVVGVLVVSLVLGGIFYGIASQKTIAPEKTTDEVRFERYQFGYFPPPSDSGWKIDDVIKNRFNAGIFAASRTEPNGWIVVDARQSEYTPSAEQLRELMMNQLTRFFEDVPDTLPGEEVAFAGVTATRYPFRAVYVETGEVCQGDCIVYSARGIGYWVFAWAPERSIGEVGPMFNQIRDQMRIIKPAVNQSKDENFRQVYRNQSSLFQLTAQENLWGKKPNADPKLQDSKAELWLTGKSPFAGNRDLSAKIELLVLVFDETGDPKKIAEDYLKLSFPEQFDLETETTKPPEFTELTDELKSDPPATGPLAADPTVHRYRVRYPDADSSANKLLVFKAMEVKNKTVVATARCQWSQTERYYWEQRMMQMVGSLAPLQ